MAQQFDTTRPILLVDLSALYHAAHHAVGEDEPVSKVRDITLGGVTRAISMTRDKHNAEPYVAICCDGKGNWRKELSKDYKAKREAKPPAFYGAFDDCQQRLRDDGFLVWRVDGMEADDIIATATDQACALEMNVVIASHDKDLGQLLCDNVVMLKTTEWKFFTADDLKAKFGVRAARFRDFLSLTGDKSDDVPGCPGIGLKSASEILTKFDTVMLAIDDAKKGALDPFWRTGNGKSPLAIHTKLVECEDQVKLSYKLVGLKYDVEEITIGEVFETREKKSLTKEENKTSSDWGDDFEDAGEPEEDPADLITSGKVQDSASGTTTSVTPAENPAQIGVADAVKSDVPPSEAKTNAAPATANLTPEPAKASAGAALDGTIIAGMSPAESRQREDVKGFVAHQREMEKIAATKDRDVALVPIRDFNLQLEPRSFSNAKEMGELLNDSRLYTKFTGAAAITAIIIRGREIGIPALTSLDCFHVIEGRPSPSAHLIGHLIERHPDCEYFRLVSSTSEKAVYAFKDRRFKDETIFEYTIEDAINAGMCSREVIPRDWDAKDGKDRRGNWDKRRREMLRKTCLVQGGRAMWPGAGLGLVALEEMGGWAD
jgi:5'-3' exonuclease